MCSPIFPLKSAEPSRTVALTCAPSPIWDWGPKGGLDFPPKGGQGEVGGAEEESPPHSHTPTHWAVLGAP